ncbi:hypothetical protein IMCC20628_01502 [Hoeflea sp. IMCC20628]|uniref:hypothetical protein n=1 Tax=Hoeflea sp. IMCC20628 TaxID=1620421 RepID=UPI00063ABA1F|nr:hypothetical protein [Hoeflea sp. IMCC20628]AKI00219.1 hypothetical protein IMCC20628_01502 [Hoeflea sp. IMCC20628]
MTEKTSNNDQTVSLLKIQGLLAGAYELSRGTDKELLSYLIKMARMEVHAQFETNEAGFDRIEKPGDMDRL